VIHFHGGPITPLDAAAKLWAGRHACVSFARTDQAALAFEVAQSVMLDNGAFSAWKAGTPFDVDGFLLWVREWIRHPAFDFAVIPDVIDGSEQENDELIDMWLGLGLPHGVPVWHMHESISRLESLCQTFDRVSLGSSGEYAEIGTPQWWERMSEAMKACCDDQGRPLAKLHGLRMLDPTIFSHLPLSSADSTNVARNIGIDQRWTGAYQPMTKAMRALVIADRIEAHASAARFNFESRATQKNWDLFG